MANWSIGELAKRADVTPRTIRYYVELGLLPPPHSGGRTASYGTEHLERLNVIKHLQAARLSLEEIRDQIASLPDDEVGELVTGPPPSSAADYLARLRQNVRPYELRADSYEPQPFARQLDPEPYQRQGKPTERGDSFVGEPWTRIPLTEDVELHVRRRGSRTDKRIARLIHEARRILKEESPE